jgi:hypothetical protein
MSPQPSLSHLLSCPQVAHLENLHETDHKNIENILKTLNKNNTTLNEQGEDLQTLKDSLQETSDKLSQLKNQKLDESQLTPLLLQHLSQLPTHSDLDTMKDLLNTLAHETHTDIARLRDESLPPLLSLLQEHETQLHDLLIPKTHEPSVLCYGNDQSARISALEAKQISLELLPHSLDDLRQRLHGLEDQMRQIMKSTLSETTERNKLSNNLQKLENSQNHSKKFLEELSKDLNNFTKDFQQELENQKLQLETKASRNEFDQILEDNFQKKLKFLEKEDENEKNIELLKEFCQELEKRVFILANECRDGLEFIQSSQDQKVGILTKWILKNVRGSGGSSVVPEKGDKSDGTDIGVKCLACNQPSSHVNQKTTVGGGYSFGASEKFGGERGRDGSISPSKSGGSGAPFRVTVPETLRSLISKSREGRDPSPLSALPPQHGDYSSTQRLYDDLAESVAHAAYDDILHNTTGSGKEEFDREGDGINQPRWNNSRGSRGFPSRPSSASSRRSRR